MIFVGVDWAEDHHDVYVMDEDGSDARETSGSRRRRGRRQLPRARRRRTSRSPTRSSSASRPTGACSSPRCVAAGYEVFAVNPFSASRYRDRHASSGAKSDPGDAKVLADLVRTDRHNHRRRRRLRARRSDQDPARAHQSMIWTRNARSTRCARRCASTTRPPSSPLGRPHQPPMRSRYCRIAPTPSLGRGLSRSKIASALRRGGRQRHIEERAEEIQERPARRPARGTGAHLRRLRMSRHPLASASSPSYTRQIAAPRRGALRAF